MSMMRSGSRASRRRGGRRRPRGTSSEAARRTPPPRLARAHSAGISRNPRGGPGYRGGALTLGVDIGFSQRTIWPLTTETLVPLNWSTNTEADPSASPTSASIS